MWKNRNSGRLSKKSKKGHKFGIEKINRRKWYQKYPKNHLEEVPYPITMDRIELLIEQERNGVSLGPRSDFGNNNIVNDFGGGLGIVGKKRKVIFKGKNKAHLVDLVFQACDAIYDYKSPVFLNKSIYIYCLLLNIHYLNSFQEKKVSDSPLLPGNRIV